MHALCFCGWVARSESTASSLLENPHFVSTSYPRSKLWCYPFVFCFRCWSEFPSWEPSTWYEDGCFSCLLTSDSWDPMDCSTLSSSILVIFQAWILKWLPISFSTESSWPRVWTWVSCIAGLFFTNCTTKGSLIRAQKAFYFYLLVINIYHLSFHPHKLQDVWPCQLLVWFIKTFTYIKGSPNLKLFANDPPSVWDFSASESRMSSTSFFRYLFNCPIIREHSWPSSLKQ